MHILLNIIAVFIGISGVIFYFRSTMRVLLLNYRQPDIIEKNVRRLTIGLLHLFAKQGQDYPNIQKIQAWVMPIYLIFSIVTWFLLVQFSFSLILWGLHTEPSWLKALSSSGSALSTLGYLTPSTLLGEYLAVYEAAIGLVIVILIFTFVPGYQSAIQARERKVGWLSARTGDHPNCNNMMKALHRAKKINDADMWEDWENWFRVIHETHSLSPILAYVPSIYLNANWLKTSAAVLDTASLILSSVDDEHTDSILLCQQAGVLAIKLIAKEVHHKKTSVMTNYMHDHASENQGFDELYDNLIQAGLPVKSDRTACRKTFLNYRAEYELALQQISDSTLMPLGQPW